MHFYKLWEYIKIQIKNKYYIYIYIRFSPHFIFGSLTHCKFTKVVSYDYITTNVPENIAPLSCMDIMSGSRVTGR